MEPKHQLGLVCVILLLPALCSASYAFTKSRASFYSTPDGYGTPTGACGFGEYGRTVQGGSVAAVAGLWKGGSGCGACYQVRCTDSKLCNPNGAHLVVTDYGQGDRTDFIMSPNAFSSLGRNKAANDQLKKLGVVDIEYQRVACKYPGRNIVFKVQDSSSNPGYFAGVLLNVGGKCDIISIELQQGKGWIPLRRSYGAVFDISNPPSGKIVLRFQVDCGAGLKYVVAKNPIPSNWKAGATYDTGVQFY